MSSLETRDVWFPDLVEVKFMNSKKGMLVATKPSWVKPGLLAKIIHSNGNFFDEPCLILSFINSSPFDSVCLKFSVAQEAYYVHAFHNGSIKTFRGKDLYLCNVPVQKIPVHGKMSS